MGSAKFFASILKAVLNISGSKIKSVEKFSFIKALKLAMFLLLSSQNWVV
jgi:hypothetical protein